jgi:Inner membrane component of T3SS, cytoplasmic domain
VPAEAIAETLGEEPVSVPVEQPEAPVEAEPEVVQPTVSEFATAAAPILEPEALPDLPSPDEPVEEAPIEVAPAVPIAAGVEPEPEPEVPIAAAEVEPEPEPEVPIAAAEVEPGPEPEVPIAAELPEPEPEPEPASEPSAEMAPQPEAVMPAAPVTAEAEPAAPAAPAFEEAPSSPQPEPEPQPVAAEPEPVPSVNATLVAWPNQVPAAPENGAPAQAATFDEATSVIPAWRQADANPARETVSLQAMPPEQVAVGSGYAALLSFETGPFAGRIVALPNQMVSIGRAPDNDVVVGDPATSGHHGRIEVRNGSFWISDLGSTNGTQVNGEQVIERQLSDGDTIAIGQNTLRFSLES